MKESEISTKRKLKVKLKTFEKLYNTLNKRDSKYNYKV